MAPLFGLHLPNFSYLGVPPAQLFDKVVELAQAAAAPRRPPILPVAAKRDYDCTRLPRAQRRRPI